MSKNPFRARVWSFQWAPALFWISSLLAQPAKPRVAARADQADQRIRFWQFQVSRDPEFWGSYNRLAGAYAQKARETGDITYFELAEASLQQSLKLESTHVDAAPAYTQLATVHLAEHRFSDAAADAGKAIALLPDDLGAYPYAGDAELELGNYEQSQHFYDHLAAPADGMSHAGTQFLAASHGASLAWMKGDTTLANADLKEAISLAQDLHLPAENLAWTQFMLGEQEFQTGDLASAERQETASLASYPRYHRALAAGDQANAEKQYAVVEFIGMLNVMNRQVYNRDLALFYADHNRKLPEALALARKELDVRHDVYTADAIAWALLKNNQPQAAQVEMQKALRLGTCDAMLHYHAGMIALALHEDLGAADHLQRALAISPHFHVLYADQAVRTLATLKPKTDTVAGTSAPSESGDAR